MNKLDMMMEDYEELDEHDKIKLLEWLYRADPYHWDFATMVPGLRNFYDPTAKRSK